MVVAEGAPRYGGHELARKLAAAGLHTTAIPDAAIFAMMARVNKVGGSLRLAGTHVQSGMPLRGNAPSYPSCCCSTRCGNDRAL